MNKRVLNLLDESVDIIRLPMIVPLDLYPCSKRPKHLGGSFRRVAPKVFWSFFCMDTNSNMAK